MLPLSKLRLGLLNCKHFCMLRKLNAIRSQSRLHRKCMYAHGELDLLLSFGNLQVLSLNAAGIFPGQLTFN